VILLPLGISTSCSSDVANRYYGSAHYPRKATDDVALLNAAPTRPYEVIADFQSRNESPESVRRKAAEIGADAVIVTTLGGRYDKSEEWAAQNNDRGMYTRIVGTAIKYK
jgi:uncharacterized protein YbjQ (UPF0145 family)